MPQNILRAPRIMELDTPLAVKWLNHLILRDRRVGLGMHTLVALCPNLNGRLGLVGLPHFSLVDWA
jgi:hypothetical protein